MKKVKALGAVALALLLLAAACGNGGDVTTDPTSPASSPTTAAAATPDVERAKEGEVNLPKAGTYIYDYESQRTDAANPEATPQRSSPDAELTSKVTVDDDVVTTSDKSSEGAAVATVERRFSDDGVYELSVETKTPQGLSGCTFSTPIKILPIPIEKAELDPQSFEGDGAACSGERTVTVEDSEEVADADGVEWSTWRIKMVSEVRSTGGVTSRSTQTVWFSPDLGKEVRSRSVAENVNSQGQVIARGESSTLLKRYPG